MIINRHFWCVSDVNGSGTIDKKDFEIAIEVSDYTVIIFSMIIYAIQLKTNIITYNNSKNTRMIIMFKYIFLQLKRYQVRLKC